MRDYRQIRQENVEMPPPLKLSSDKITADSKTRKPVGTFACDCGYIYSRTGPDCSDADRYRKGRVKVFGLVWEERLKSLLMDTHWTYRNLAERMGCDIKTIQKFSAIFKKADDYEIKAQRESNIMAQEYKENLLNALKAYPELSRTQIRKLCKKEYSFFYRHEKDWLLSILPAPKHQSGSTGYVDWNKRDHEILQLLKSAYSILLNWEKPIRITKTALGKMVNKLSTIEKHLNKLPYCAKFISQICEIKSEFQLRRCCKIAAKMRAEGVPILEWKILREAGLRKEDYDLIKDDLELFLYKCGEEWQYGQIEDRI
jgi:transcriptional regulator with XRE-family HTH domain